MTEPKDNLERDSSMPPKVSAGTVVVSRKVVSAQGASIRLVEYSLSASAEKALNVGSADKLVGK